MGMRDKKRNQKRVLARRTAAPRSGEGKDFLVSGSPLSSSFFFS
jgi:nucleolar protein 15